MEVFVFCVFQTSLVSVDGLNKFILSSQLTADFDGTLPYDNVDWIEIRLVREMAFVA